MQKMIKYVIKHPRLAFGLAATGVMRKFFKWLPDRAYLKIQYFLRTGKILNLDNPQTFNEKLQWLKLHNRKPEYTRMVDKASAKAYVAEILGDVQHLTPTIGVWDRFEDIDFTALPDSFVLKCTHDSGGVVVCPDKSKFDVDAAKRKLASRMKRNFYYHGRELVYKDIVTRIIAEEYIGDNINDYKFHCFNGEVKAIQVDFDRFTNHKRNMYTPDWDYIPFSIQYPTDPLRIIPKPLGLDEMVRLAEKLSAGIAYMRVDLYYIDGRICFGEFTFHPESGFGKFAPKEWGYTFGQWIELPNVGRADPGTPL